MAAPVLYEAYWIPGLDSDVERDEGLEIGFGWLGSQEQRFGAGLIAMYAKSMVGNAPLLGWAAERWEFISRRARGSRNGPTLAIWPDKGTLELAEQRAFNTALCVIPNGRDETESWIWRTGAVCLIEGYEAEAPPDLPQPVTGVLNGMLDFDGHNGFIGAGGKQEAIRTLRVIANRTDRPSAKTIEAYLQASGKTTAEGAARARKWYEEILSGKKHRDHQGREIR